MTEELYRFGSLKSGKLLKWKLIFSWIYCWDILVLSFHMFIFFQLKEKKTEIRNNSIFVFDIASSTWWKPPNLWNKESAESSWNDLFFSGWVMIIEHIKL